MMSSYAGVIPSCKNALTILDLDERSLKQLEKKMYPGMCSGAGFLAAGESLKQVCVADWDYLKTKGLTCAKIACAFDTLLYSDSQVFDFVEVNESKIVTNGYQECPFGECHRGRKMYHITNCRTGESFAMTKLVMEMIKYHGYFEGHTIYRVEPAQIIRVLELDKIQTSIVTKLFLEFRSHEQLNEVPAEMKEIIQKKATRCVKIDAFAEAYFGLSSAEVSDYRPVLKIDECSFGFDWRAGLIAEEKAFKKEMTSSTNDEEYCYVFNYRDRKDSLLRQVEGMDIESIKREGIYVYRIEKKDIYEKCSEKTSKNKRGFIDPESESKKKMKVEKT